MNVMKTFKQGNIIWISVSTNGDEYFRSGGVGSWQLNWFLDDDKEPHEDLKDKNPKQS